jgi:murein L,D-transpeptidase YafK
MLRVLPTVLITTLYCAISPVLADELPTSLIRIPESVSTIFVAETSTAQFHRFDRSGDDIVRGGSYYMSIGREGAGKEHSGDKRTPLGVYFVTEQLDTSQLHDKYGVTAFPLDYPNAWDKRADRDGDGIWVHGVDRQGGRRPVRDTDGCIALPNEDLLLLSPEFRDNVTPVLVTREVAWADETRSTALRIELENRIAQWAQSKSGGDLHAYLSLYDDEFERWGMNKKEWSSFNVQTKSLLTVREITISDLLLLEYPEEQGVYLSRFRQQLIDKEQKIESTARLYWRRDSDGELKIIAEDEG